MTKIDKTYALLLEQFLLEPITDDQHLERALALADDLSFRSAINETTPEEEKYLSVLYNLIADYEARRFTNPSLSPIEVVRALMEFNGLTQADLAPYFGGAPKVSEFLNGKRDLSKEQICRLSERFKLTPSAFFPKPSPLEDALLLAETCDLFMDSWASITSYLVGSTIGDWLREHFKTTNEVPFSILCPPEISWSQLSIPSLSAQCPVQERIKLTTLMEIEEEFTPPFKQEVVPRKRAKVSYKPLNFSSASTSKTVIHPKAA